MNTCLSMSRVVSRLVAVLMGSSILLPTTAWPTEKSGVVIPDFSSELWVLASGTMFLHAPGDPGPGPIVQKGKPFKVDAVPYLADTSNPILKPWAKKLMDVNNQRVLAGDVPFYPTSRCWPGGVPGLLVYPGEPVKFLQTPKEVLILYQRDSQVRHIYMNVPHSKNPAYSWYGESVGHYEGKDTLVVDTIGLSEKVPIDRFRTPHTKLLHVIERYRLLNDGKTLETVFTVEDSGAFTQPWKGKVEFEQGRGDRSGHWVESICAENPADYFGDTSRNAVPIPTADTSDF
jgi:hypothetical protein